jgi:DNA-binding NtrC family response regulator
MRVDDEMLDRLAAAGRAGEARAWLAALRTEAWLRGTPTSRFVGLRCARLRLFEAEVDEAVQARHGIGDEPLREEALRMTRLPQCGGSSMYGLHAIPSVLQLVADADDELMALKGAAGWARASTGAHMVAFVGGADARVVAGEGAASLGQADRLGALRAREESMEICDATVRVIVPVRYAGAYIGGVIVAGLRERQLAIVEAARTIAALCGPALRTRLDSLARVQSGRALLSDIIGSSPAIEALREAVARAAGTPFPVLIEGESGTGKELVARALHRLSPRRDRRFSAVNCAALTDELVEAELFGHTRGAFTGAVAPRTGLFEDAHGGTLFLDEVGELSPRAQAKLLRVLQEREVRRVGENVTRAIDVRVVAATNRPLAERDAPPFRADLLFRLAVVRLRLPPLRERTEDIAPLASTFWRRAMTDVDKRAVLGADALSRLALHPWPGNVRELQNVMAALAVLAPLRGRIGARHVDQVQADAGPATRLPPLSLECARRRCEQQTVAAALARNGGRRSAAARELGLTRQGLVKIMRRLRLQNPDADVEGVA